MTSLARQRRSKVWITGAAAVVGALALAIVLAFLSGSSDPYRVRAIFDDAANLTPGEQVKVAGVPVGSVESVTPTWETPSHRAKAAVVMSISNPGFEDFRADAFCIIRPQSLLGEKYVDCRPTEARAEGAPLPAALSMIPAGREGAGERLLPLQNTSSPIDADLLTDINQLPERERLRIILNELGAGLAGRGEDLHEVIVRADPALRETNRVLAILASENRILSKLTVDSSRALAPFAQVRRRVADFIVKSNTVASASARHEGALERNLADFPAFLEALGPAMERIRAFAQETTPVFSELGRAAPAVNRIFTELPAFSSSSTVAFKSLGRLGESATPALKAAEPLLEALQALGSQARPFAGNFSSLLESLKSTGGIERLMDFIFLTAGATNGYNALGHFLRADLTSVGDCVVYVAIPRGGCGANFIAQSSSHTARRSSRETLGATASAGVSNGGAHSDAALRVSASLARTRALLDGRSQPSDSRASRLLLGYLLGE